VPIKTDKKVVIIHSKPLPLYCTPAGRTLTAYIMQVIWYLFFIYYTRFIAHVYYTRCIYFDRNSKLIYQRFASIKSSERTQTTSSYVNYRFSIVRFTNWTVKSGMSWHETFVVGLLDAVSTKHKPRFVPMRIVIGHVRTEVPSRVRIISAVYLAAQPKRFGYKALIRIIENMWQFYVTKNLTDCGKRLELRTKSTKRIHLPWPSGTLIQREIVYFDRIACSTFGHCVWNTKAVHVFFFFFQFFFNNPLLIFFFFNVYK